ncbi:uncharacterized protein V2V93DRAFT_373798 [Kockiozyma suomiensis]|uniref:uncharacterized protein n=1 Tax=Kockiozyma suomiensis TaxID=1337062 RepID=UPI003343D180
MQLSQHRVGIVVGGANLTFLIFALFFYYSRVHSHISIASTAQLISEPLLSDHIRSEDSSAQYKVKQKAAGHEEVITFTHTATQYAPEPTGPYVHPCEDPYQRPGYLYIPPYTPVKVSEDDDDEGKGDERKFMEDAPEYSGKGRPWFLDAAYVPYYDDLIIRKVPSLAQYPLSEDLANDVDNAWTNKFFSDEREIPASILKTAPINWMQHLRDFVSTSHPSRELRDSLRWLRNKRILIMADSLDRDLLMSMCAILGLKGKKSLYGHNTVSYCSAGRLNFTIYHWDLASMYISRPKWWWLPHMEEVSFENRTETIFKDHIPETFGDLFSGAPDLVLYQSLLYDWRADMEGLRTRRKFLAELNKDISTDPIPLVRPMLWFELDFYRARQQKFITYMRDLFGNEVPFLFRAAIPRGSNRKSEGGLYALDAMARLVANSFGVEVFEWGHILEGYSTIAYSDSVHVKRGPHAVIYANMLLYYLFRAAGGVESRGAVKTWPSEDGVAAGAGWEQCSPYRMPLQSH